ncbi:UvrD-helicase domain-containing protein [bacterium]|nr:UvrD-helicase domain-containing protein [bacterium]
MKSYNVLDPTSPLFGKIFIEASAGTGKTFAIEHMVIRLLLKGIPITKILVVTFTKAGADDLKSRIHALLLHVHDLLEKNNKAIPYLKEVKDKKEVRLLIDNACILMSDMPVCTIHSFAFQQLSSFAFEGGVDFDLLHFEDEKQKDITLAAILDAMRTETTENNISTAQCTKMLDAVMRKLPLFTAKIASMMDNDKKLAPPTPYKDLKERILKSVKEIESTALLEELYTLAPSYKRTTNRQKEIAPHLIEQVQALAKGDLDQLILSSPSIIELLQEENLKKGKTLDQTATLPALCKRILPTYLEAKDPKTPMRYIAWKAKQRRDKLLVQGPDAILHSMKEAIQKEPFRQKVEDLYDACIIDEFQDTDPIQWEILSTLYLDHAKLFCTVGDPKQSIYAFRGADLPTYLQAKKCFETRLSLSTNYRSHPLIIDTLNALFSESSTPGFLSFEQNSTNLTYQQVKAGRSATKNAHVELLLCNPPKEKTARKSLKAAEEEYFLPHLCNTIKHLGLPFDSIAVLVKDRYQGLAISLYLQSKNIPVQANISSSLVESSLFALYETLLFYTYHPRSESLLKKLLSHPVFDTPLDLLKEDLGNSILQQLSIEFSLLLHTLENKGLAPYLAALTSSKIFGGKSLEEILAKNGELFLTFTQITSLLLSHFEKDPKLFLSEVQKLNPDVFTFLKKGTGTDKKSVTIMTSHLSKGLEFEAVFALSLYTRMKQEIDPKEALAVDKEKMRLLYVTLTRAKSYLYIYGTIFGDKYPLEKGNGSPLELFLARVGVSFLDYDSLYQRAYGLSIEKLTPISSIPITLLEKERCTPLQGKEDLLEVKAPTPLQPYQKPPSSLSFSSLPFEKTEYTPVEAEATFPYGSVVGNRIHLIFEKVIEEGLYYPFSRETIFPILTKSFFQTELEGYEEVVYEKIKAIFTMPLTSNFDTFSLEEIAPDHLFPEVLFHYKLENSKREMKGFIDLLAYHKGKYYLIDWKCNHLPGYEQEDLQHALHAHHYDKQAAIYTRALKAFLDGKGLSLDEYFGGVFYLFVRGGKKGSIYFNPKPYKDEEVLCLKEN